MDHTDIEILRIIQKDAKRPVKSIASELHLTTTPVFERIKKLENKGVIENYGAHISREKLGLSLMAFCSVSLGAHDHKQLAKFAREVQQLSEVMACYHVTGPFDYLIQVLVPDMEIYQQFITQKLSKLDNIRQVQSFFVMTELIKNEGVKLDML
jgi:Lrp/AsnC family leucine-responsive transcriptional regulator